MIPVCRDKILICSAGTDFTLRLHGKIKFHPGKVGQFSTWYLFRFVCRENFVPAKQDPGSIKEGPHLAGEKFFTCNRMI